MLRRWAPFVGRLVLGLAILMAAVAYGGIERIPKAVAVLPPELFVAALLLTWFGSIVLPALVTRFDMKLVGLDVSFVRLMAINLAMRFYVLMLPHALSVGIRWQRYRDGREGVGVYVAALIAFERTVQLAIVVTTAALFLAVRRSALPSPLHVLLPIAVAASVVSISVLLVFVSRRAFAALAPLRLAATRRLPEAFGGRVERVAMAIHAYRELRGRGVLRVVLSLLCGHMLFIASGYVVARGLGLPFGFLDIGWMRSVVYLVTLLPLTIAGIGVREAGFASLFVMQGVDKSSAIAFPLVLLGLQLVFAMIGALLESVRVLAGAAAKSRARESTEAASRG